MNYKLWKFTVILILMFCACDPDEAEPLPEEDKFEKCCDEPAFVRDFNPGKISIPNVYTPNGDNINDRFHWFFSVDILSLESMVIKNEQGEIVYELEEVFSLENANWILPNDWNLSGKYTYQGSVRNVNEDSFPIEGAFCAVDCKGPGEFFMKNSCVTEQRLLQAYGQAEEQGVSFEEVDPTEFMLWDISCN